MKVSIIGVGNVGGTLAQRIAEADLADVVMVDIAGGIASGKSLDLKDAKSIIGHTRRIEGTTDYKKIAGSGIVVVPAGLPRQPGMSREDLLKKNVSIVKQVINKVAKYAPGAILLMVTNPLDILTYIALKESKFNPKRVIGMGGVLDSSRLANLIAKELKTQAASVQALVIGAHGKDMIPLLRYCSVSGISVLELLSKEKLDKIIDKTIERGAEIVALLGKGSAYYAPSAAAFLMVKAVLKDEKKIVPASVYLNGEYGLRDVCVGVPISLGKDGVEDIIELKLTAQEKAKLNACAVSIKKTLSNLV